MVRSLLVRGLLAGALAGLLAFVVAYLLGEPQVQRAIDVEEALARAAHEPAGPELVSRGVQRTLGVLTGTVVVGVAVGGFFALIFAWAYGRIGAFGPRGTAALLGLGAFVTITLVPFTKYPANPPGVGDPDTIDRRTVLFVAMIVISMLAAVAAWRVRRQLMARLGPWNASLAGAGAFIAVVAVAQLMLPAVDETPAAFPAELLYRFRLASLAVSLTLWATLTLAFAAAAERLVTGGLARRRRLGQDAPSRAVRRA